MLIWDEKTKKIIRKQVVEEQPVKADEAPKKTRKK